MLTQLVQLLFMINILVKTISSQYYANPYYQNMAQPYYQVQSDMDYEAEPNQHSRRSGHQKKYGSSGGRLPIDYDDEGNESEECPCNECKNPKPCCKEACLSCPDTQGSTGFVFIPYPYPLVVPNLMKNKSTTAKPTTTTVKTTSSDRDADDVNNILRSQNIKGERKYMLTSFRKTKPTWESNYGIVPIPDTLAENLMAQLRNVKELQVRSRF